MAEATQSNQDLFICPVCLDLLKDPVSLNCGHNYCTGCIKDCWDQEDLKGVYSCPQCRQTFTPRPCLNKNNIVAELVEQFRKTRIQAVAPAPVVGLCAGPGEVECDLCLTRKLKAVKSCLDCLLSYCEPHLALHNQVHPGRKHKVVDATPLQERICTQHEKSLEVFCRTDQTCVCLLCVMDEHKGHDTVSASAGRKEKETHLGETQENFKQRIQEREKEMLELRKAVETLKSSAQTAVEDSETIFTEMIRSIERRRSEVTELIRAQEKAEVSRAEEHQKQLEQEIAELKRRDAELEQLSHTEDHIHFIKTFQSLSQPLESLGSVNQNPSLDVKKSVSSLKEQLETFCTEEFMKISATVTAVRAILQTRKELLQYSCHFTLDPNTANSKLHLSEGNRRVENTDELQSYPDHPERFDVSLQVLCREGVSGCCYWEVEWSNFVYIAVSYKSISRKGKGDEFWFGGNDQSWRLRLSSSGCSFMHNTEQTKLPLVVSSRIGVYVDHSAGTLAFYSISDTITLLHRVQTTFTQPLYPGFAVSRGSSLKLL
ncbi:tripartite motif-containing protein 16-like [Sardina pilchardus]|uniref:tripartite motif-containing protein 16-like n=1 Tax=Sardina pilchardus TaxID=27697 RepID=UPI002E129B5A